MRLFYTTLICLIFFTSCVKRDVVNPVSSAVNEAEIEDIVVIDPLRVRATEIVSMMDDNVLAGQILITGTDGRGQLPQGMIDLLTEIPTGGVMLFRYNLDTDNDGIRNLLSQVSLLLTDVSGVAPFIAVDHEGGTVNRFQRGVATLPAAASYWNLFLSDGEEAALEKVYQDSFRASREINDLGFNMNFAPVTEHLVDDNREFLHSRSYGPDPVFTAKAASAFKHAMESNGVLCVIKHFPGSAGPDPHYSLSVLNVDRQSLDLLAFPFTEVIKDGARAVMAAHTSVPIIDSEIASLSEIVMQNWLRDELGFDGIIISDDFVMAAAGGLSPEEAAVRSVAAGADMILVWQRDLRRTHEAFISAVEDGQLPRERLINAAQRVIYEKLRMGLME